MKKLFICIVLLSFASPLMQAQNLNKKGAINIFWGWNKEYYSNSNIHFTGDQYNFTLNSVQAKDRFKTFSIDPHLTPGRMTLPQTNFRLGYFIKDNVEFTFGIDHMKYVMVQNQEVGIEGAIHTGSTYDGDYRYGDRIVLAEDFLQFEHTDGLNYGHLEIAKYQNINDWLGIKPNKFANLYGYYGGGFGLLVPKTNTQLLENDRYDEFNVAGFGLSTKLGVNLQIWRYFVLKYEWKVGYINMQNIRTTQFKSDRAKQEFFFTENMFMFGLNFNLK